MDLGTLMPLREEQGGSGAATGVEVSASFLGRRTFNRYDAEDAGDIAAGIRRRFVPLRVQRVRVFGAQPFLVQFAAPTERGGP
ncbi:hypothetical protein GCM10022252_35080 [Streptosporangium oxazolinicum]|uniref:Uncharacterized protein n=1 Tax=Streptosporangium oxazolinicum TaxID=909287 RepID=A0ABP8AXF8_9ACTN